jgi:hypothetical protein
MGDRDSLVESLREEVRESMVLTKNKGFRALHQDCLQQLERIKSKNDSFSRQAGLDLGEEVLREINQQIGSMKKDLGKIKAAIEEMEGKYKNSESRAMIREVKQECVVQTDRLLRLTREFVARSFVSRKSAPEDHLLVPQPPSQAGQREHEREELRAPLLQEERVDEQQFDIESRLHREKEDILRKAEQDIYNIKDFIEESAKMIYEHRENIELISDNIVNTHKDALAADSEIKDADREQRRGTKKYLWLLLVAVAVIVLVVVVFVVIK